jgi:hypothetical protein
MAELVLNEIEAGHLGLHVGLAAQYAAVGEVALARSEAILGWAVLAVVSGGTTDGSFSGIMSPDTLPRPGESSAESKAVAPAYRDARDSALALLGHFTTEQQFGATSIYERVVAFLDRLIEHVDASNH